MFRKTLLALSLLLAVVNVNAQSNNLLQNPNADAGGQSWHAYGDTAIDATTANPCFIVHYRGNFHQDVQLSKDAANQYAVFIGYGASERVNADGSITGAPYLYGYMMQPAAPNQKEILAYLQGQRMLAQTTIQDAWVIMWGIYQVPEGTTKIRFFMMQGARAGDRQDTSAARFDNLGLYLFRTKEEAEAFVRQY